MPSPKPLKVGAYPGREDHDEVLDWLGGEPLDGSGVETEEPEPDFDES
jgi:hypothetical protein